MKTIIVAVDFSKASTNAAFYAAEMAMHIHACIALLHVLPLPVLATDVPIPADSFEISVLEANKSLKELKLKIEKYSNDKLCVTCSVTTRSFLEEMKDSNKDSEVFAVIMGTTGTGATEAFFLGSFSLTAARQLHHPLIIVPPRYQYNGIGKIGIACDMRNVLETIPLKSIKEIVAQFNSRLEILYVSKPDEKMYPQVLTESKFIQNSLASLHPEIRIATDDDIKVGLEDFVHKSNIDLLILIRKERILIENIFHKSMTKKMVLHPEVPLMVLHQE